VPGSGAGFELFDDPIGDDLIDVRLDVLLSGNGNGLMDNDWGLAVNGVCSGRSIEAE
jgi:hypothetical protein